MADQAPKPNRARALILGLSLGLACVLGWFWFAQRNALPQAGAVVASSGQPLIGGPFTLVDGQGRTVTNETFRGRYMLVYFGFTHCPDICPTELMTISTALNDLEAQAPALAARIQPLFITVDPERDTPQVMGDYVKSFHPRLIGLTGAPEQVALAKKSYRVYAQKAPAADGGTDYNVDHSSIVFLMDPVGRYVAHFAQGVAPEAMAAKLKTAVQ
jgi:cytochrome oxidase Cu insertion factor (SCO1/SenC/PrrC family)